MIKKNKYLFYILGFFAIISAVIIFSFTSGLITIQEFPEDEKGQWSKALAKNWSMVEILRHYTLCDHTTREEFYIDISQHNLAQLQAIYPAQEGWSLRQDPEGIRFSQELAELCPDDEKKRHLAVVGDYLAVFKGPVGVKGFLERITDIRIDSLPMEWQEKVYEGLLTFADEAELLEALDSLDEYQ